MAAVLDISTNILLIVYFNHRYLTAHPHIAGEQRDFDLVNNLKTRFVEYGLDSVTSAPYEVLLSYPDKNNPNKVLLVNSTGAVLFDSTSTESNISHLPGVIRPFLAYSPSGVVNVSGVCRVYSY